MLKLIFEAAMVLLFGASWPANVLKSYKSRTAKGKSLLFLCLIFIGYICGIIKCLIQPDFSSWLPILVLCLYCINLIMVATDIMLYFRNTKLDSIKDSGRA